MHADASQPTHNRIIFYIISFIRPLPFTPLFIHPRHLIPGPPLDQAIVIYIIQPLHAPSIQFSSKRKAPAPNVHSRANASLKDPKRGKERKFPRGKSECRIHNRRRNPLNRARVRERSPGTIKMYMQLSPSFVRLA